MMIMASIPARVVGAVSFVFLNSVLPWNVFFTHLLLSETLKAAISSRLHTRNEECAGNRWSCERSFFSRMVIVQPGFEKQREHSCCGDVVIS